MAATIPIRMRGPDATPIVVETQFNEIMKRHEVIVVLGNFATKADAEKAGRFLVELMQKHIGAGANQIV